MKEKCFVQKGKTSPILEIKKVLSCPHGGIGIGMSRLQSLSLEKNSEIEQEVEITLKNTFESLLLGDVDHLCCGNFGRIEFLRMVSQDLRRPELLLEAKKYATGIIQNRKDHFHFFANLPKQFFTPGFMVGASGIGYSC